jgi:hypothetical protein
LAADARKQRFYVSIAVVPPDCWWISVKMRELFRENAPRVSTLLHGNNHTRDALARATSDHENLALLAQALRRFRRLEQQPGIEVCRVMECPHDSLSVLTKDSLSDLELHPE